jgi:hypothetical protein
MLHEHVHGSCPRLGPCCMSMLHVLAACPCPGCMSIVHVVCPCPCYCHTDMCTDTDVDTDKANGHEYGHVARTWKRTYVGMDMDSEIDLIQNFSTARDI